MLMDLKNPVLRMEMGKELAYIVLMKGKQNSPSPEVCWRTPKDFTILTKICEENRHGEPRVEAAWENRCCFRLWKILKWPHTPFRRSWVCRHLNWENKKPKEETHGSEWCKTLEYATLWENNGKTKHHFSSEWIWNVTSTILQMNLALAKRGERSGKTHRIKQIQFPWIKIPKSSLIDCMRAGFCPIK